MNGTSKHFTLISKLSFKLANFKATKSYKFISSSDPNTLMMTFSLLTVDNFKISHVLCNVGSLRTV